MPEGLSPASHIERMQRAHGLVDLSVSAGAGGTVLHRLRHQGCLRLCFPRTRDGTLEAVLVNTAGGIADSDTLNVTAEAATGTRLTLTTQAPERIYRARVGAAPATIENHLRLHGTANLAFLPQETILFDGASLTRHTHIDMAENACFLGFEALIFGRAAHGETITHLQLHDLIELRRAGRLILHDAIRLTGEVHRVLSARAGADGQAAVATLVLAAPHAPALRDTLRVVLAQVPARAACSAWDGMLVARFLAGDAGDLRQSVVAALGVLREGAAVPRVWG